MEKILYDLMIRKFEERSFNAYDFEFYCGKDIKKLEAWFHIGSRVFVCSNYKINNLGFWIHEFSELTIIGIIEREGLDDWKNSVKFDGYKKTYISHLISPYGYDNEQSLNPQKSKHIPVW